MSDLQALYQEVILDHAKRPRNFRVIEPATGHANGYNPLCGDKVSIYLRVESDRVADVSFKGAGCAISTSSASILTETLKGKTVDQASRLFDRFHSLVTGQPLAEGDRAQLGKLAVFSGVSEFPARVKCATLAWHTFMSALSGDGQPVTTEGADNNDQAAR